MSVSNFKELMAHIGHEIVCVTYDGENVSLECEDCCEVLLDFDKPLTKRKKSK